MFELIIILSRYLFVFYILYFLWQGVVYVLDERGIRYANRRLAVSKQRVTIIFMHLTAFLILAYVPGNFNFNIHTLVVATIALIFLIAGQILVDKVYVNSCHLMWNGVFFLLDIGLITLQSLNPALAQKQLVWFYVGFIVMLIIPRILRFIPRFEKLEIFYLLVGGVLLILPSLFGARLNGAVNWIRIGSFSFQPSEIVKFLYIFYLASVFRKKMTLGRHIFTAIASAVFVCILVYQRDLGGALIYSMTYVVLFYISTGSELLLFVGLGIASTASVFAYRYFPHIQTRFAAWRDPWSDIDRGGYQIAQSLFAIGTWGIFGSGLTRGAPQDIPVVESDFIFSAICEQFGLLFAIGLIGVFIMIFYRGVHISLRCKRRYYSLLAAGFTSMLSFQTFLILGGVTKLIPLTGVTLPFVSYGGSSILVSIMMIGIIEWIYMVTAE